VEDQDEELRDVLDQLRSEVERLRALAERLVLGADDDRRNIERSLHGGPLQVLVAVAMELQLAAARADDPPAAKTLIDEAAHDVQSALDEMARLAERIYPPLLGVGGLAASLRSAAAAADAPATVDVDDEVDVPPAIARTLYLLWLNALDHVDDGGSTAISVRQDDDEITFDVTGAPGPELDRLRDRVEALGGVLAICVDEGRSQFSGRLQLRRRR
jgi:signal transduction histidine kinase